MNIELFIIFISWIILLIISVIYFKIKANTKKLGLIEVKAFRTISKNDDHLSVEEKLALLKASQYGKQQGIAFALAAIAVLLTIVLSVIITMKLLSTELSWELIMPGLADIGSFAIARVSYKFYNDVTDRLDRITSVK